MSLHIIFRIACAMCFIGHGAFGIITKPVWCNYFSLFGIGEATAYKLMPFIGIADIILGIMVIVYPLRAAAGWLVFWGLFTAALRPLSGEPFAEFIERAGNFGAPLVLLLFSGPIPRTRKGWFEIMRPHELSEKQMNKVTWCLRVTGSLLLLGHGWLNVAEKGGLLKQYVSIGTSNAVMTAHTVGVIEIAAAIMILVKPVRQIVLVVFIWKMMSEVLYPAWPFFEWVERAGSYGILLGLWVVLREEAVRLKTSRLYAEDTLR